MWESRSSNIASLNHEKHRFFLDVKRHETKIHWFHISHIIQQKNPGDSQKGEGSIHRSEKKPGPFLDYRIKMC